MSHLKQILRSQEQGKCSPIKEALDSLLVAVPSPPRQGETEVRQTLRKHDTTHFGEVSLFAIKCSAFFR